MGSSLHRHETNTLTTVTKYLYHARLALFTVIDVSFQIVFFALRFVECVPPF